jgi:hypothetical protein
MNHFLCTGPRRRDWSEKTQLSGTGPRKFEKKYFFAVFNVLGHSEYFWFLGGKFPEIFFHDSDHSGNFIYLAKK